MTTTATGWATDDKDTPLAPRSYELRELGPHDVRVDIAFCGLCHSDVHQVRDEWPRDGQFATNYPCLPGHEIAGTVAETGAEVTTHAVGDRVAIGCLVDSCDDCESCQIGQEQFCPEAVFTYNTKDEKTGEVTFGGYADGIVARDRFVLKVPDSIDLQHAGPIVCSGVTTWSPLKKAGVKAGDKVGIAGIGGLGSIAIKLAKGLGAEVVALTTSPEKADAARAIGADDVIDMTDPDAVEGAAASLAFVLSTIPTAFDANPYLSLLAVDGALVSAGALEPLSAPLDLGTMSGHRVSIGGTLIGGIPETQEVLDFCAEHGITPEIELMPAKEVNDAFDKVVAGDVRFRYVIDASTVAA